MAAKEELSPTQSMILVKNLVKNKTTFKENNFKAGKILMYFYLAKDQEEVFDRTPLVFVLKRNKTHTLGLNFHWLPVQMRLNLIKVIFLMNKKNIQQNKELEVSYKDLKPYLMKNRYKPCIRLYINSRISSSGVVVPEDKLIEIAKTKSETFTGGKHSAEKLYSYAVKKSKK